MTDITCKYHVQFKIEQLTEPQPTFTVCMETWCQVLMKS